MEVQQWKATGLKATVIGKQGWLFAKNWIFIQLGLLWIALKMVAFIMGKASF
jgi:hypothetical protein